MERYPQMTDLEGMRKNYSAICKILYDGNWDEMLSDMRDQHEKARKMNYERLVNLLERDIPIVEDLKKILLT